jgi:hypothetical protein
VASFKEKREFGILLAENDLKFINEVTAKGFSISNKKAIFRRQFFFSQCSPNFYMAIFHMSV